MKTYTRDEVVTLLIDFVNDLSWGDLLNVAWCKIFGHRWIR